MDTPVPHDDNQLTAELGKLAGSQYSVQYVVPGSREYRGDLGVPDTKALARQSTQTASLSDGILAFFGTQSATNFALGDIGVDGLSRQLGRKPDR